MLVVEDLHYKLLDKVLASTCLTMLVYTSVQQSAQDINTKKNVNANVISSTTGSYDMPVW